MKKVRREIEEKKCCNSRALIGVEQDWKPHELIFFNWTTFTLGKVSEFDLPTLVDELPLDQEGGGPHHLLLVDVLDHDDEVA